MTGDEEDHSGSTSPERDSAEDRRVPSHDIYSPQALRSAWSVGKAALVNVLNMAGSLGLAIFLGIVLLMVTNLVFWFQPRSAPPAVSTDLAVRRTREMIAEGDRLFDQREYGNALERYGVALQYLDKLQQQDTLRATVLVRRQLAAVGISLIR